MGRRRLSSGSWSSVLSAWRSATDVPTLSPFPRSHLVKLGFCLQSLTFFFIVLGGNINSKSLPVCLFSSSAELVAGAGLGAPSPPCTARSPGPVSRCQSSQSSDFHAFSQSQRAQQDLGRYFLRLNRPIKIHNSAGC